MKTVAEEEHERVLRIFRKMPELPDYLVEVLRWSSHGLTDEQISTVTHVPYSTVKERGKRILRLLAARNRAHAVAVAMRLGLMS